MPTQGAELVSPWQLAGNGGYVQGGELERLLVLLQSPDDDQDTSTGTHIATYPEGAPNRSLGALSDVDVANLIDQPIPGRTPVGADVAVHRFISQMVDELWTLADNSYQREIPLSTTLGRPSVLPKDCTSVQLACPPRCLIWSMEPVSLRTTRKRIVSCQQPCATDQVPGEMATR